ncbi:hypothetical protein PBT90_10930 [Algoriphagus halophytocola]|uniref:Uncharacterized protein n=1 Tax=Algoriphagus halophytocola TaxID=2991499 RepID=A0ABY6MJE2_9BACT|nr:MULTISPECIES: hypothetical protein [unclassified Algoriphagus]UZD23907.1 hypothetical protein OM944_05300 [Algoriphagus sp. TR-M5]WBL41269.1 hypothetical protein PBT90_10930 [Algoriphagus sp. TR-M9]
MKNPTIKELLEKLTRGEISKSEFDLLLTLVKEEGDSPEFDQAFQEIFDELDPNSNQDDTPKT